MRNRVNRHTIISFSLRFIIVHTLTYAVFGIVFMLISQYFDYFLNDPLLNQVMKSSDSLTVRLAIPVQILRGALLSLAIYPFREVVVGGRFGWLKLFFLLFVLTSIGSVITGPGSIEGFLYTKFSFDPLVGYPEIGIQMFAFSWLFCHWQRGKASNLYEKP
jgi:phosphoglycerol transferase MdoB-like AlkP superfamily enzyme